MRNKKLMVEVIPYIKIDGIPTMKDSYILSLIDQAEEDGTLSQIFYGDSKYTKFDFLRKLKTEPQHNLFYIVKYEGETVGFGLLDGMSHNHAYGHFCGFKKYWGKDSVAISKEVYRQLLKRFSVLVGIVPSDNMFALRFCERIGMIKMGSIPRYYYNDKLEKHVDGVVFHITSAKEV